MTLFDAILGPEPTWLSCACGALTSRVPCWDCEQAATARAEAARERAAALSSIPKPYEWATVSSPDLGLRVKSKQPLGVVIARALAATRVVFAGPSGAGKTSLACACLRERMPHGLFLSALRLGTARIQHHAGDGVAAIVERAIAVPLLLLDEVGGESKTSTNAVRDVIFARHEAALPTWITTGMRSVQLAEIYGDGMLRRLTENAYVVQLGGET